MPAPYKVWGKDLEQSAIQQMDNACSLPISVKGALLPDCHTGYGLPVGGVLATRNAVIPYAVGVDISCSVNLSILDIPPQKLETDINRFKSAIARETQFGIGACFKNKRQHAVMDEDWRISPITHKNKDKAWAQLGTSGSGNHFVEFGVFKINQNTLGLKSGEYIGLLSHSGSRGTGALVCKHYSKLAEKVHPECSQKLKHLAWLSLEYHNGHEYWKAMQLMHQYATANHELIHHHIAKSLGATVLFNFINSHNLAWEEVHDKAHLIVHRKGATPAEKGMLGIIPGSMASPTYLVQGLGNPDSLNSCSHGAGRLMSRTKARKTQNWHQWRQFLKDHNITLMSAGIDEVPGVYKNIDNVMAAQKDLVEIIAKFHPRLVKMAPGKERPKD